MFVFREAHYASRFEERCREEKLPYERHEEEGEVMFGIAKTHFQAALRANHLVHAEFRSHFIPNKGWRWGLLAFTGAVLALALWGWLTATSAHGQFEAGLPWELDVVGRMHVPSDAFGMEPTNVLGQGIDATWTPRVGTEMGLRIHRRLKDGWTLGGGVEWVRREHGLVVSYTNDTLGLATADTLPQMRSLAYRLPLLGGIRVPLGYNDSRFRPVSVWGWSGRPARPWSVNWSKPRAPTTLSKRIRAERGTSLSLSWQKSDFSVAPKESSQGGTWGGFGQVPLARMHGRKTPGRPVRCQVWPETG